MNPEQAAAVLAKASSYDNRKPSQEMKLSWAQALPDIDPISAIEAVIAHYGEETRFVMPADIRRRVQGTNAQAPYNRTVREAFTNGTVANCDHGYAAPERECGICRRGTGPLRIVGAA